MSNEPIRDNSTNGESIAPLIPPTGESMLSDLHREVERLRAELAKVTAEAETYRRAAYSLLNKEVPYIPPTEEELHDLLYGQRGRSIFEIVEELERDG